MLNRSVHAGKRFLMIVNPFSGKQQGPKIAEEVKASLEKVHRVHGFFWVFSTVPCNTVFRPFPVKLVFFQISNVSIFLDIFVDTL